MQKEPLQKKQDKHILVFNLSQEELGFDLTCVREVIRFQEIHSFPHAPDFILGVTNVRKHAIAVIDLRKRFAIESLHDKSDARINICKLKSFVAGVIVDSVNEVLDVPRYAIQPTPEIVSQQKEAAYIAGIVKVGDRVITLLDLEKILTNEEMTGLLTMK